MPDLLRLTGISKSYATAEGPLTVLRGVGFVLDRGQSLALTGESGSGKSTILHIAGALDDPDAGEVALDGIVLGGLSDAARAAARRDRIGLVFQQFNLIPSLTVGQNIAFQARMAGRHEPDFAARVTERLGLSGLDARYPEHLSGGQQQRVAIARALVARPALILADEPTGNLDEAGGERVLDLFLDLVRETGAALLMVSHSTRLAARLERRLHLSRGRLTAVA